MAQPPPKPKPWSEKRRSQRLALSIPVLAYRVVRHGNYFCEGTRTLVVSAHGALLSLTAEVAVNQKLMLKNAISGREQECRVVFTEKKLAGPTEIAVEFQQAPLNFWEIAFPPADWLSASQQTRH